MTNWDDVIARARGLATHLLSPSQLADLATATDLPDLCRRLDSLGMGGGMGGSLEQVERALRRLAGQRLAHLARWCGPRTGALRVLYDDEDRRSLRALVRGQVSGASPESRLAGLVPTPELPLRALEELARLREPAQLAGLLTLWEHPYRTALAFPAGTSEPDLIAFELALSRIYADRIHQGARRGDTTLREFVTESIDLENLANGMLLAGSEREGALDDVFLPGGSRITRRAFGTLVDAQDAETACRRGADLMGQRLGRTLGAGCRSPAGLETALLARRIEWLQVESRHNPLGTAPVLVYALRVRQELLALQGIVWGLGLGAPPRVRAEAAGVAAR